MKKRILGSVTLTLPVLALMTLVFASLAVASESSSPLGSERARAAKANNPGKLRIIAFGAHPDDCEIRAGGVAARSLVPP